MPSRAAQHRRYVRRVLVGVTGTASPDRAQLAEAFDTLCDRMRAQLYPLFGATATDALFARGLHLATSEFPWLAGVVPKTTQRCASEGLAALHPELPPEQIGDGLTAVLAHTFGLLTAFIGLDMTLPLVEQAWGVAASADGQSDTTVTYE